MSNCKCEYVEEVNPIQSGVRIHKLVKRCEECEAKDKQANEESKARRIADIKAQIKLLDVDVMSANTLGYEDVAKQKREQLQTLTEEWMALDKTLAAVEIEEVKEKKVTRKKKLN